MRSEFRSLAQQFVKDIHALALGLSGSSGEAARSAYSTLRIMEGLMDAGVVASFWTAEIGSIVRHEFAQIALLIDRRFVQPGMIQEPLGKEFFGVEMPVQVEREPAGKRLEVIAVPARKQTSRTPSGSPREELILKVLGRLGSATIKDILKEAGFGEVLSEKTLQRELIALISSGKIVRHGERRWSRYTLPGQFPEARF